MFGADGSWQMDANGRVTSYGRYAWSGEDLISLTFPNHGSWGTMIWRVQVERNTLRVVDGAGKVVRWSRVNAPSTSTAPRPTENGSQRATVEFTGAVVGLSKHDKTTWDLSAVTSIPEEVRRQFEHALLKASAKVAGSDPELAAAGVVAALGLAAIDTKAKPDPMGTVELTIDGQTVGGAKGRHALPYMRDTFTPVWSVGPWSHIPLDSKHDVRLRLHLEDYDPDFMGGNDPIGTVMINSDDLLRAARLRKVLPVYVGDQSQDQLVFVYVSVTMEGAAER
jgi:hypothetical protein